MRCCDCEINHRVIASRRTVVENEPRRVFDERDECASCWVRDFVAKSDIAEIEVASNNSIVSNKIAATKSGKEFSNTVWIRLGGPVH